MDSNVPVLGSILSVWAHPDDESYLCAGLMAAAVRAGHRVVCVTATRGEQGSTDPDRWPNGPALADIRTREMAAALAAIGVTEHVWLDYPDGGCADVDPAEAVRRIRDIALELQPAAVLTFGPDGQTGHSDHIAVGAWTTDAVRGTGAALHYSTMTPGWIEKFSAVIDPELVMMTDAPPVSTPADRLSIHTVLDGELLDVKFRALLCQETQVGPMLAMAGPDRFRDMVAEEAFRSG